MHGPNLRGGDLVLLKPVRKAKLQGLAGPFKVLRTLSNKAVEIASLVEDKVQVVHETRLMRFTSSMDEDEARRLQASDYEEYVVESVRDHDEGRKLLLVKWEGYDAPTWEPKDNLSKVKLATDYIAAHKLWRGRRGGKR